MRGKNLLSIGKEMYVTLFYQLEMYQFQKSDCGNVICRGMIEIFVVLFHIIFLLSKPYHFPNFSNGPEIVIHPSKELS